MSSCSCAGVSSADVARCATERRWCLSRVRAICGLGIAVRLFQFEHKYSPVQIPSYIFVHRKRTGQIRGPYPAVRRIKQTEWEIDNKLEGADRTRRALDGLKLHTLDGWLDTEEKKISWSVRKLQEMKSVFSAAGDKGQSIILASQWLLDSYTGQDELLNYVQAMVVLEILLGDKATSDEIGLGQLLRNRCAYLIGGSHEQRAAVLRTFDDIYRVRSQIVHRGKHRLIAKDRWLFHQLLLLCHRVLQKEVDLLIADARKGK
jgi:Apea-like HEPN